MTPAELARTLLMVRRAGYTTISAADYAAFMRGDAVSLPPQPILLTFDDARTDAFRGADAILAALGDRATIFDVTDRTRRRATRTSCAGTSSRACRRRAAGTCSCTPDSATSTIPVGVDASGAVHPEAVLRLAPLRP